MRTLLVLLGVGIAACATAPARSPGETGETTQVVQTRMSVPIAGSGSLATFVPVVAAVTDGGECDTYAAEPGVRLVIMSFPSRAESQRTVALRLDAKGNVLSYSDLRGDRRPREARTGPLTAITINFEQRNATAANERRGQPDELVFGTPEAVMSSETLGRPGETLKLVTGRCAGAAAG